MCGCVLPDLKLSIRLALTRHPLTRRTLCVRVRSYTLKRHESPEAPAVKNISLQQIYDAGFHLHIQQFHFTMSSSPVQGSSCPLTLILSVFKFIGFMVLIPAHPHSVWSSFQHVSIMQQFSRTFPSHLCE